VKALVDLLVITFLGILLSAIVGTAIESYRRIRKAQLEYEKAKATVDDVVLSFNRDLRRENEKLGVIAYKVEGNMAKIDVGIKRIENVEKKVTPLEQRLTVSKERAAETTELADLAAKVRVIEAAQESLKGQMVTLDEHVQKFLIVPEAKVEPVIPIKRDKAMAALTDTEVAVLEMLSAEGAKTAPEIKERVQLSREHTARLMKKLYEEGYLERETGKIPFKYNLKKEMERLLKKPESTQI
jgi:CTP-dependent riboflavin kinase